MSRLKGCAFLVYLLLLTGSQGVFAQSPVNIKLKFVPRTEAKEKVVPDPTKLSDLVKAEATADSEAGIARVVFEVNDQFKAEVKTPPYLFNWDTLEETDGESTLSAIAYNNNGQTGTVRLKVTVENQLSKGIMYYAEKALEAMRRGDEIGLERASRRAYKINTQNPEAVRVMAVLIGLKGDINRAFGMLNDNQNNVPKDAPETLEVKGFLLRLRAFRNGNLQQMLPDLQEGMTLAKEQGTLLLRKLDSATPADKADTKGRILRGDAFTSQLKNTEALAEYEKASALAEGKDKKRAQLRQVMSLLRLRRLAEAEKLALKVVTSSPSDPKAHAVYATTLYAAKRYQAARDEVAQGILAKDPLSLIVACLSDLLLNAKREAYKEAQMAVEAADGGESQYAAMCLLADAGEPEPAKKSYINAALNAPLFMPVFIERAFQNIAYEKRDDRFVEAITLFDVVLRAEPDNAAANGGRAYAMLCQKRYNGAKPYLTKFSNLDPTSPDLFVLLAADASRDEKQAKAVTDALSRARFLEPVNFKMQALPPIEDFARTMMRFRRVIPLTPSLLDR